MSKKASLHILIPKMDFDLINAFSPNHGDRTRLVVAIINNWCKEIRKGKTFELPDEIQHQLDLNVSVEKKEPVFPVEKERAEQKPVRDYEEPIADSDGVEIEYNDEGDEEIEGIN